jgi:hypothetical protein
MSGRKGRWKTNVSKSVTRRAMLLLMVEEKALPFGAGMNPTPMAQATDDSTAGLPTSVIVYFVRRPKT